MTENKTRVECDNNNQKNNQKNYFLRWLQKVDHSPASQRPASTNCWRWCSLADFQYIFCSWKVLNGTLIPKTWFTRSWSLSPLRSTESTRRKAFFISTVNIPWGHCFDDSGTKILERKDGEGGKEDGEKGLDVHIDSDAMEQCRWWCDGPSSMEDVQIDVMEPCRWCCDGRSSTEDIDETEPCRWRFNGRSSMDLSLTVRFDGQEGGSSSDTSIILTPPSSSISEMARL